MPVPIKSDPDIAPCKIKVLPRKGRLAGSSNFTGKRNFSTNSRQRFISKLRKEQGRFPTPSCWRLEGQGVWPWARSRAKMQGRGNSSTRRSGVQEGSVSHSSEAKMPTAEIARAEQRGGQPRDGSTASSFPPPPALCCDVRPSFLIRQLPVPLSPLAQKNQQTFSQKNAFTHRVHIRRAESYISLESGMGMGRARRISAGHCLEIASGKKC